MRLNSITRFMIIFKCALEDDYKITQFISMGLDEAAINLFEYLIQYNTREYALITSIIDLRASELHDTMQNIRKSERLFSQIIPGYKRIVLVDRDDSYLSAIEKLHREYNHTLRVSSIIKKKTILLCDLGDVVWDECLAQKRMAEIAIHYLNQSGYSVSKDDWLDAYKRIAMACQGERFYRCIESLSDKKISEKIRNSVQEDFVTMSDKCYFSLHPLRDGFIDTFYEIQKECDILFVSNQPEKAYILLRKYKIGVISPLWILSCEYGIKKPDIRLFNKCMEMVVDKKYKNKYVCGNRKDMDLMPVSSLGYKSILFLCENSVISEREVFEDFTPFSCVRDFCELRRAIIGR